MYIAYVHVTDTSVSEEELKRGYTT